MMHTETEKSYHLKDFSKVAAIGLSLAIAILILAMFGWDALQDSARFIFHQSIRSRLEKEIDTKFFQMYPEDAEKLAVNKKIIMLAQGQTAPDNKDAMIILQTAKQISGASIVYVMNSEGTVVGCSPFDENNTLTGDNYSFRPYFAQAMQEKRAAYPALGVATNIRGIYFSTPIYSQAGSSPIGVVVIKTLLDPIDATLDQITEPVALLSPDGIVFATNRLDWMYHAALPIENEVLAEIRKSRQFSDHPLSPLQTILDDSTVSIDGVEYTVRRLPIRIKGWQVGTLASLKINYAIPTQQLLVFWGSLGFLATLSVSTVVLLLSISKQKKVEKELRRTEEKYRSIFENAVEGIFQSTPTRRFIDANASLAKIFGFDSKEALISHVKDLAIQCFADPDDFDNIERNVEKEGRISGIEKRLIRKDGQIFWGSLSLRTVRDRSGKVLWYEGTLVDISERKDKEKAERQKEIAELAAIAKNEFLANMSHEIRTPMNAVLGYAQILSHSQTLSAEDKEHLNIISRSGEHLLALINDVLELSKIDANRIELQPVRFDLHQLLADLEAMFRLRAARKGLTLSVEYASDVPASISADQSKLRQILINLLGNAVKYTKKGEVTLKILDLGFEILDCKNPSPPSSNQQSQIKNLKFEVTDTGIGIASADLEKIFDAFVRVDEQQYHTGTGLGLPISRKYVRMMDGDISVDSEKDNGSTFSFEIPVELVEPSALNPQPSPPGRVIGIEPGQRAANGHPTEGEASSENGPYRLLIVENDGDSRNLMVNMLKPLGFDVCEAQNGEEAVELWNTWQPHLIWMDMRMPVMDGYEATRKIRKQDVPQPVIIALTASAFEEDRRKALETGCDDFVRKPFRESEIFNMLHSYLGVRLIYEEPPSDEVYPEQSRRARDRLQAEDEPQKADRLDVLTMEAFDALPSDVFARLRQAVKTIDLEMTNIVIDDIRGYDMPLAETLTALVKQFRFDTLREVLKEETG